MKKSSIAIPGAVAMLAVALASIAGVWNSRSSAAKPSASNGLASPNPAPKRALVTSANIGDSPAVIRFVKDPAPAPAFLVQDLDGDFISTASLQGKVALLNFWATWCSPCRAEIPEFVELQSKYKDKLQIVGISVDDAPADQVKQFSVQTGINYPIVMSSRELLQEYGGAPALPTTFVVNREGGVVQKHVGFYPMEVYEEEIRALLGFPVAATIETFVDNGQVFLKNAANATEFPGLDLSKLSAKQKALVLRRMNSESCTCGCNLTLAQCRINDSGCSTSLRLATQLVKEISSGASKSSTPKSNPSEN